MILRWKKKLEAPTNFTKCYVINLVHRTNLPCTKFILEVAWWPLVPKFAGSNPTEAVGFFRAKKILSTPSFGGEVKPAALCRRFTACKGSLNVTWKSGIFRQNSSVISRPCSSNFGCWDLLWTTSGESWNIRE